MSDILSVLGENIKQYRKKTGLSQLKLAYQLEISPSYLVAIENGKQNPSVKILEKFANFFGIETYKLLEPVSSEQNASDDTIKILKNIQNEIDAVFQAHIKQN